MISKTKSLNSLLKKLHKQYNINFGGCCKIAEFVASELEAMNEPFWLIIQNDPLKGNHYCILSKNLGYINKGKNFKHFVKLKASSKTINHIYKDNDWSKKYDSSSNERIKKIIHNFFKTLKI